MIVSFAKCANTLANMADKSTKEEFRFSRNYVTCQGVDDDDDQRYW